MRTSILYLLSVLIMIVLLAACSTSQQLFQAIGEGESNELILRQYFLPQSPQLKQGDKITVSVWGHEELSVGSVNSTFNSNEATGRWLTLDNDGEVNLPNVGRVKLAGYNRKEVSYLLEETYGTILQNPIVNIKVLSHYVTILGEVNTPGRYQLDNELADLVQLLGRSGGFSDYAKPQAIRVIRHTPDGPVSLNVDLTNLTGLSMYNVVLQPDDLVYVLADKKKQTDQFLQRATPIAGILTSLGILVSLFTR